MTPIHDQGYRRYGGERAPHGRAWQVIARAGLVARLQERRFIGLLIVSWVPFLVRAVQLYIATNFPQAAALAPSASTYRAFLDQQSLFVFFVTIAVGAGAIANDRRANALQIYLSKPITRVDYVTGKFVTLAVYLLGVTLLPALALLVLQILLEGSARFLGENLFLIPAITLFSAIQVFVSAFAMLALSSLSRSHRFVAVMYAGLVFFTGALYQVLRAMTGSRVWAWISPEDTLDIVADAIFRVGASPDLPVPAAFGVVIALIGASIVILERRIKAVEVVT